MTKVSVSFILSNRLAQFQFPPNLELLIQAWVLVSMVDVFFIQFEWARGYQGGRGMIIIFPLELFCSAVILCLDLHQTWGCSKLQKMHGCSLLLAAIPGVDA